MKVLITSSYPTLCDPMDCSLSGYSVHGILQARIMEWVAILFFSSVQLLSCIQLFETPWNVALQDPLSMEFSRQEYWTGLPFPSPGYLLDPGTEL